MASISMRASSGLSPLPHSSTWPLAAFPHPAYSGGAPLGPQGPGDHGGDPRMPQPLYVTATAAGNAPVVLTLASFAVTKLAYVRLTKQFREMYMQRYGIDVRFRLTFAGSGVQVSRRRALHEGRPPAWPRAPCMAMVCSPSAPQPHPALLPAPVPASRRVQ